MVFSWANAESTRSRDANAQTMAVALNGVASRGLHVDVLDDVAQIAGGVPQGLRSLGLANAVEGADHQAIAIRGRGSPDSRPFAERKTAEVGSELRAPPRGASVGRDLHLGDSVSAVEGDSLDCDGLSHRHASARLRDGDEGTHRHSRDGYRARRRRARLHAAARRVGDAIAGLHPELLEDVIDDLDLGEILDPVGRV